MTAPGEKKADAHRGWFENSLRHRIREHCRMAANCARKSELAKPPYREFYATLAQCHLEAAKVFELRLEKEPRR
jgi:hypothetical protein